MCATFILIYFSSIEKQAFLANHARIRSWNEPVLSNESKVSCEGKQWGGEAMMGLELTTDRYPPITSQTRYPLCHAAYCNVVSSTILV